LFAAACDEASRIEAIPMRSLLLASAVIALAAISAPKYLSAVLSGDPGRAATEQRMSAAPDAVEERSATRSAAARQVEIGVAEDGHFYVDAEVNFRTVRLMVDTGATVIALRESDAREAGLRLNPRDFEFPVGTANGTAYAAEVDLDSIAVADIEVRGVRALVLPDDQLSVSLLGASFLNRLERFEIDDGTLIFEN
jgi:aspartyl protease family protein